ncbi:helix-turn-helix transcriptional regulator [Nitratireductor sp. XY-223]|uniref:helix-turn-helix transcriptional regulator n=1 Tax=Nitratireductor sp. XY-223 TaxID=2561926 RepID=UPI0010AA48EE|nr:helix-turn-helix transcriptional regulator [Nitratireductor sp. XY-223]
MSETVTASTRPAQIVFPHFGTDQRNTWDWSPQSSYQLRGFTATITAANAPGSITKLELLALLGDSSAAYLETISPGIVKCLLHEIDINQYAESAYDLEAKDALFEIRRLTGYPWEEIAKLIGVDRRTLHNWVKGGHIRRNNDKTLKKVLMVLRSIDPGDDGVLRKLLARQNAAGESAFELIARGQYETARKMSGVSQISPRKSWASVDPEVSLHFGPDELLVPQDGEIETVPTNEKSSPQPRRRRAKRI